MCVCLFMPLCICLRGRGEGGGVGIQHRRNLAPDRKKGNDTTNKIEEDPQMLGPGVGEGMNEDRDWG